MVFNKVAEVLAAATNRLALGPQSSAVRHMPSGLPPQSGSSSAQDFLYGYSGRKNSLKLSSSLQDLSSYQSRDFEEASFIPQIDADVKRRNSLLRDNASSFSKEKGLPNGTPFLYRWWVRLGMIFLCFILFALLIYMVSMYVYTNLSQQASKFYVVLDCGSTGTRAYVYQASIDHRRGSTLPIIMKSLTEGISKKRNGRAYDRMETEPGFDKLVHNITGLKAAIKPLIGWAEKQIPKSAYKSTSLFLYATAGLRRLPKAESDWLLDNVWLIFEKSPFSCRREWVKIISGTEEAYYGWTALNYQTGMLGAVPRKATFGALDLGGSSLQVTFENKHLHNETNLNLRIGSVNHHLSAYSLSGYGLNDAFGRSVVHLLKKLPNSSISGFDLEKVELKHPCLQAGYKERYICSQCATLDKTPQMQNSPIGIRLIGAPDWDECASLAKSVVNYSEMLTPSPGTDCDLQPCALPDGYPHPYGQFYAVSGFFVVYRFFNLPAEAALDDVLEKGREFCGKTWEIAKVSVPPQPFIEQYCFRAPYIASLLREGLHITDKQIIIGSGSITWTLGVALLEAGKTLSSSLGLQSYELLKTRINPIIVISVLVLSLLLLVCALSRAGGWMPRYFRRSNLPLFRHNSAPSIPSPFRFQRWSPINTGDGKVKTPLSPTVGDSPQRPFGFGHALGGSSIQLMETSLYSASSVSHSHSSDSLGTMQFDSGNMGTFWSPRRSQMRLQSRRSQSREDLNASIADAKV